jgi:hypothetical protein
MQLENATVGNDTYLLISTWYLCLFKCNPLSIESIQNREVERKVFQSTIDFLLGFLSRAFNLYLQRFFLQILSLRTTDHERTLLIFRKI